MPLAVQSSYLGHVHVMVHLAVAPDNVDDAVQLMQASGLTVHRTHMSYVEGWCGVVVRRSATLSRRAAMREETQAVTSLLDATHLEYRYIATDTTPKERPETAIWPILRPEGQALGLDRWLRRIAEKKERGLRRRLALRCLSVAFVVLRVSASNLDEARRRAALIAPNGYLHPALARVGHDRLTLNYAKSSIIAMPVLVTAVLFASVTETFLLQMYLVMAGVICWVTLLVWMTRTATTYSSWYRDSIVAATFISGTCGLLGLSLAQLPAGTPGERGKSVFLILLFILFAFGLLVVWRSHNITRSFSWVLPLAFSTIGALAVLLGTISYRIYFFLLGIPSDAVALDVFDRGAVGILALGLGVVPHFLLLAVYGISRWMFGFGAAVGKIIASLAAAVSVVVALGAATYIGVFQASVIPYTEFQVYATTETEPGLSVRLSDVPRPALIYLNSVLKLPEEVCVRRVASGAIEGGPVDEREPWLSFGVADARYTIWRPDSGYRRMSVNAFDIYPPLRQDVEECNAP